MQKFCMEFRLKLDLGSGFCKIIGEKTYDVDDK